MGCVNRHRTVPVNHKIFLLFSDTIFVFFLQFMSFFQFCRYYSEIFLSFSDKCFLSFLHLTSTVTFSFKNYIYVLCIELTIIILIQRLLTNPWKSESNYHHILKQRLGADSHYFLGSFHVYKK